LAEVGASAVLPPASGEDGAPGEEHGANDEQKLWGYQPRKVETKTISHI
jgi:hypothetical protein